MRCCVAACFLLVTPLASLAQQGITKPILSPAAEASTPTYGPATGSTAAASVDPSLYIIGPEDNLQITVWKEPAISGAALVRPDGNISVSLVGDLKAAGLTPAALARNITTRLKKFIQDPDVTVGVLMVHPKQVFLLGEVQHVGPVVMTPGMTLLQAISAAGGLTPFANAKHIYILRGEHGKQLKIPFNYKKAIKDGNQQGIVLLASDTIVVP